MGKKTTKRISVCAAILLAFAMLLTALVLSTDRGKEHAFADGEQGKLLYIVDAGRVNDTNKNNGNDGKLGYGYDPATSGPAYVDSTVTFVKKNGGTFGDITDHNGEPLTRLLNSYTDKPFGADEKTGKYWGFNENYTTDMPHRLGRSGNHPAGFSEFRSVNDEDTTTERLTYKFEVPEGIPLDVTVITRSMDGWGTVNGKMSVNGGNVMSLVAGEYDTERSVPDCMGVPDSTDNKYYLTLTFGEEGAQTVVNGFIIREKPFDVIYHLDGGTNSSANKATFAYGAGFTLADPTRTGYAFDGWYDAEEGGNRVTEISDSQKSNVTLYARWIAATYTVTYDLDGGTNNTANKTSYTYGAGFTLADPARTDYTFDGWYDAKNGGNKVTAISDSQTGNVTLYARWIAPTYTVTYDLGGGDNDPANTDTYTYGIGLTLADPTRTGYTFDGWYDAEEGGNRVTEISDSQKENIALYARWIAATYTVTYDLDGGTNNSANKTSYTYGAGFTLADPTRTDYTFDGWYDAKNGGNKVTAISDSQTGNVTLYARWTKNAAEDDSKKSGCNSSVSGAISLCCGLLLSAGAIVIVKCKKKN